MNPTLIFQATILLCFGPVLLRASAFGQEISWHGSGKNGAVGAGHSDSVAAGIKILEQGGRAADAAAATILALSVTDYGSFAIGGEVPVIIYDAPSKQVKVLNGIGARRLTLPR